jgi:hypothetical protein
VPSHFGAIRQKGQELPGAVAVSMCSNLVPPLVAIKSFEIVTK